MRNLKILFIGTCLVMSSAIFENSQVYAQKQKRESDNALASAKLNSKSPAQKKEDRLNKQLFQINKEKQKLRKLKNKVERREAFLARKENRLYQKINKQRKKQGNNSLLAPNQEQKLR